jgi:hypothetical protein
MPVTDKLWVIGWAKHQRIEVMLLHPPEAAGEVVRQEVLREALGILNLANVRHDVSSC